MASTEPSQSQLQNQAYEALNSYFLARQDDVVEIEILPPSICPPDDILMQDGLNLGVPKKVLALAYVEARNRFLAKNDNKDCIPALQATKVMLLFDPEHLTAANFRKRRLLALDPRLGSQNRSVYYEALRQELCFLNSILTSPLHRQSKSPTLWYHRLWLLDLLQPIQFEHASENKKSAFWRAELDAVCKSGEQHPKNYYAWQYARRLMSRIEDSDVVAEFARRIKDWCCKHPSDISGWSFLLSLLYGLEPVSRRGDLVRDVLIYAINFRFEQESLWVFIRTALAHGTLQRGRGELIHMLQDYHKSFELTNEQSAISERVENTLYWIYTYGDTISGFGASDTT